ncbi:MAG: decaprenyl-phosphate phosphoribosyltransferase [Proteobacteria bacterium]|nr:MAG: decaprenyl-phosphate phosphoribosyltransferase [Pseudomonadota bacterium]QKK11287.1 MAG: decaprenyl-phosphate phosphoribosyltransferase [Pseudomonadota bacterium]
MIALRDLLLTLRPHQWVKNGFVLMGLLFGHAWNDPTSVRHILGAFAAFCLVSSAVYVFNDLIDRDRDRRHPEKRNRPIAAGRIAMPTALGLGCLVGLTGLALAAWAGTGVLIIVVSYMVMNAVYSVRLKHVVILDVFIISAGFMLRILAGTWGVGIPPSHWLLFCGMMVTLFLGFAKRRAEMGAVGEGDQAYHRAVLAQYTPLLLDTFIAVTAMGVIISYSLYTMSPETITVHGTDNLIFTVPFIVYGLFRYVFLLHASGSGGDPSRDLFRDLHLLGAVIGWLGVTLWMLV